MHTKITRYLQNNLCLTCVTQSEGSPAGNHGSHGLSYFEIAWQIVYSFIKIMSIYNYSTCHIVREWPCGPNGPNHDYICSKYKMQVKLKNRIEKNYKYFYSYIPLLKYNIIIQ